METKAVLKGLTLFAGLDDAAIDLLASIAERKSFPKGGSIYCEGDEDSSLFVLASGAVRIDKIVNFDQQQTLDRLQPGDFFGEVSFVLGGEHCASAQALQETEIVQIRRTEFDKLARRHPDVGYRVIVRMAVQLAERLRAMDEKFVDLVDYIYGRAKR